MFKVRFHSVARLQSGEMVNGPLDMKRGGLVEAVIRGVFAPAVIESRDDAA